MTEICRGGVSSVRSSNGTHGFGCVGVLWVRRGPKLSLLRQAGLGFASVPGVSAWTVAFCVSRGRVAPSGSWQGME